MDVPLHLLGAQVIEHWDEFQEFIEPYATAHLESWLKADSLAFDAKVRFSGPTVMDVRKSYCIYKGPDVTTPYIVHNLYELIAFMAHPRHGLNMIDITTRDHPKPKGFKMIPLPWEEVKLAVIRTYKGNRPLAIFLNGESYHTGTEGRPWW